MRQPVTRGYAALFALSFISLLISWSAAQTAAQTTAQGTDLADAVTTRGVRAHMAALSRLADENGGNRAAATPGYAASVRYVERTLRDAGYRVRRQPFTITFTETLAETGRVVGDGVLDLAPAVMEWSPDTPEGGLRARLTAPAAPLGCAPEDFAGTRATVVLGSVDIAPTVDVRKRHGNGQVTQ